MCGPNAEAARAILAARESLKKLSINDAGAFVLTEGFDGPSGVLSFPTVRLRKDSIRIGCHVVTREAWLKLHELWNSYLTDKEEKVVQ